MRTGPKSRIMRYKSPIESYLKGRIDEAKLKEIYGNDLVTEYLTAVDTPIGKDCYALWQKLGPDIIRKHLPPHLQEIVIFFGLPKK